MPRSIWKGAISFGLINVPVKMYSAVSRKDVRFHQLHAKDGVRIKQKRVCPADDEEVPYEDIVKGYEISPGEYVVIEPEELDALDADKTQTIDIESFVDLDELDPLFFQSSYYLVPDKAAAKSYTLLRDALAESNKVAIARVVMRTKEHLAAMRVSGDVITLSTMLFHDEVVNPDSLDELPDKTPKISDKEVKMARQLIEALTSEFDPREYKDTYRERVLELIQAKAEGEEIAVQPVTAPAATKAPDLMKVLEESIAAAQGGSKQKKRASARSRGAGHAANANGKVGSTGPRTKARSNPKPKPKTKAKSKA